MNQKRNERKEVVRVTKRNTTPTVYQEIYETNERGFSFSCNAVLVALLCDSSTIAIIFSLLRMLRQ